MAAVLLLAGAAHANVAPPQAGGLRASAAVSAAQGQGLRLLLDVRVGVVSNISISSRGDTVRIDLRGATREEIEALVRGLNQPGPDIRATRSVVLNPREAYVLVELARPLEMVDQTLTAAPGDRSRWEIVLAEPARPAPGKNLELADLQLTAREDLLDIRLVGSPDLTAEVSITDNPPQVIVELPGATPASVERYVANFRPGPYPLVKRVSSSTQGGVPRIAFELFEDVDLVDSDGAVRDGRGNIRISLARDATARGPALQRLQAIEARLAGRQIDLNLAGVDPDSVRAYTLSDPPRLVMDVLGLSPQQAQAAAGSFRPPHPGVLGVRVEATRLGSARLVFDLSSQAPVLARSTVRPGPGGAYSLALRTPANPNDPGYVAPNTASAPVSVAQRGPRVNPNAPLLVIRPVTLEPPPATGPLLGGSGLMALLATALQADPKYQGILKDFEVATEGVPQARAALLPTLSLDYLSSRVQQNITRASNPAFPTGSSTYPNKSLSLTLTQPLVKLPAIYRLNQAERSLEQARFNVAAGEQDLILRLATAYLNVAAAQDGQELAEAERAATEKQLELARARLNNGLGNVTQVHDADARFSLARAKVLEARNRVEDARQGLTEIIGKEPVAVKGFKGDFAASGPLPSQVEPWLNAAVEQNLSLVTRRLATQIAELEVSRQKAGYAPSVNLTASTSRVNSGGSLYGSGQAYNNNEVGFRISMPLFEGGSTSSLVREAGARLGKAQTEYDQELRRTERVARGAFSSVVASIESQAALRQAVVAQQSALDAREEGLRSGLFTPVAVIDAYRLFYAAQRDYLQARYDYLVNRLKLKQAVGILSRNDLEDLNALLEP